MTQDTVDRRWDYAGEGLPDGPFPASPWDLIDPWVAQARASEVHEPMAMSLASVDAAGMPSVRTVLLRFCVPEGPGFVSYSTSAKAEHIAATGVLAASLTWTPLHRAIRFRGRAVALPEEQLADYFRSRPWGSRISAWASRQTQPLDTRVTLERRYAELAERYPDTGSPDDVPVPPNWSGWRIDCDEVEFWSGRSNRLHDRWSARRTTSSAALDSRDAWQWARLQP